MHSFDTPLSPSIFERLTRTGWQVGALIIAVGTEVAAVDIILNDSGPIWKRVIGFTLLTIACAFVVAGLVMRRRARRVGSTMVAVGVTPGIVPIVLFWFLPAVAIGLFGIAVFVFAVNDAEEARRIASRPRPVPAG